MFPALNMLCLIPNQSPHETHHELHPDQYVDDCHSVQQMMTMPQETLHLLLEQLQQALQNT